MSDTIKQAHRELEALKSDAAEIRSAILFIEKSLDSRRDVLDGMKNNLASMEQRIAELERLIDSEC